jgi:small-conductance mechanosensitive channel
MTFSFLNNSLENWGSAIVVALGATAAMYVVRAYVLRRVNTLAPRTETRLDDLVADVLASTYLLFIFAIGLYLGSLFLDLPRQRELIVSRVAITALLLQLAIWGDTGLRAWREMYRNSSANADSDGSRRASSMVLSFISRLTLWVVIFLLILENLGFNITTLIASLGIGGIAVALAVQNILGDLFASLSIMLDKPFEIGDFIIVGDVLGPVEHIGLKTTRVRSIGGEQVVLSNGDLLKSRIRNHKRLETRRVAFILRVSYGTSEQLMCKIPQMVGEIIKGRTNVDYERTHFVNYGDWSLDFEVVYHYRNPDYVQHLDAQQAIFLELYRLFEREGIQFAHPLSVVRLAADDHGAARLPRQVTAATGNAVHQ